MSDVSEPQKEAKWQLMDRATAQRKSLLTGGYVPIPINGKAPIMPAWQKQQPTVGDVEKWPQLYPCALNTGILTRATPTVDIDVYDADVVTELRSLLWSVVGDAGHFIVRVGQAPKCAIPFQTDQPFAKISTPIFTSPDGRKHHVEVLGDGQQVVVFGRHPDPGGNYTWQGGEPGSVIRDALPYINAALAAEYVDRCTDHMRKRGWLTDDKKRGGAPGPPAAVSEEFDELYGEREQKYALAALSGRTIELARTVEGGRNEQLNKVAYRMGTMIVRGWIEEAAVINALLGACDGNKYLRAHGYRATMKTIESGIEAGKKEPHPDLPDREPSGDNRTLSDLSDLSAIGGTKQSTSDEQPARGRKAETGTWEEPDWTLLDDRRGEVPDFPVDALLRLSARLASSRCAWRRCNSDARRGPLVWHCIQSRRDSTSCARVPLLVRTADYVGGHRRLLRYRQDTRHGRYQARRVADRTRTQTEDRGVAA